MCIAFNKKVAEETKEQLKKLESFHDSEEINSPAVIEDQNENEIIMTE